MIGLRTRIGGLALVAAATLGGCNVVGWVGQSVGSDKAPLVNVTAEYLGLANQSVAVLVDVDYSVLDEYPRASYEVAAAVSQRIAANVPGVKVIDASQIIDFQRRNIYWPTMRYSELARRLAVSRLVLISLTEYRTHEPGNINLYKGVISATVGVVEADGPKPDDMVYQTTISATYPPGSRLGVPDANPLTIRKGMIDLFAIQTSWKFYDHKEQRSK